MEQENFMNSFMEDALEMVFSFDDRGIILNANKTVREALGYADGFYGVHISEIFPADFLNDGQSGGRNGQADDIPQKQDLFPDRL